MGNKAIRLRKGKRTGLTRNQMRKEAYAKLAAANVRGNNKNNDPGRVMLPGGRKKKTNHKRGAAQDALNKRREDALIRSLKWESLHAQEQLASLDARLGKGVGATKQRAKIATQIEKTKLAKLAQKDPAVAKIVAKRDAADKVQRAQKQSKKEAHDRNRKTIERYSAKVAVTNTNNTTP